MHAEVFTWLNSRWNSAAQNYKASSHAANPTGKWWERFPRMAPEERAAFDEMSDARNDRSRRLVCDPGRLRILTLFAVRHRAARRVDRRRPSPITRETRCRSRWGACRVRSNSGRGRARREKVKCPYCLAAAQVPSPEEAATAGAPPARPLLRARRPLRTSHFNLLPPTAGKTQCEECTANPQVRTHRHPCTQQAQAVTGDHPQSPQVHLRRGE